MSCRRNSGRLRSLAVPDTYHRKKKERGKTGCAGVIDRHGTLERRSVALNEGGARTDDGGRQHGGRLAEGGHVTDAVQAHVQHRQLLVLEYTMVGEEEVRLELDGFGVDLLGNEAVGCVDTIIKGRLIRPAAKACMLSCTMLSAGLR